MKALPEEPFEEPGKTLMHWDTTAKYEFRLKATNAAVTQTNREDMFAAEETRYQSVGAGLRSAAADTPMSLRPNRQVT